MNYKERIELMSKLIDEGYSLSYAKFLADKKLGTKFNPDDRIVNEPAYKEMKLKYKQKMKQQRSFHKCID